MEQSMRRTGRETVLTPEFQKEFVDCLLVCCTIKTSCEALGISESTYQNWRKVARNALLSDTELTEYEETCLSFIVSCREARGKAKRTLLLSVMRDVVKDKCPECGRSGSTRDKLKMLAQFHPEEYSEKRVTRTTRLEGSGGGPVQFMAVDPREFLRAKLALPGQLHSASTLAHAEIQKRIGQNNPTNGHDHE